MGFFKRKDATQLQKELEAEEKELSYLELKASFAEQRRELKDKIKGVKKKKANIKYGNVKPIAKEIGKGFVSTGKMFGGILGEMAENQKSNSKKKKKTDEQFGFF